LSKLCEIYTPSLIDTPFHNAGNDIYVTAAVLKTFGDPELIKSLLNDLDEDKINNRVKNDEIDRIKRIIPILNRDLELLMEKCGYSLLQLLSEQQVIEDILLMHQNIYRRMMRHGNKDFWSHLVALGVVGELFELASPLPEKQFA
jgi:hypothetical protein